jgi:hypothetical protein
MWIYCGARAHNEKLQACKHRGGAPILKYAACMVVAVARRVKIFMLENDCVLKANESKSSKFISMVNALKRFK